MKIELTVGEDKPALRASDLLHGRIYMDESGRPTIRTHNYTVTFYPEDDDGEGNNPVYVLTVEEDGAEYRPAPPGTRIILEE
jgi:hypothetical protein